jgi:hypothetical protein
MRHTSRRHSKRPPFAGDLEPRFDVNKPNWLNQSGVPARAPQGLSLSGMTRFGWTRQTKPFTDNNMGNEKLDSPACIK